MSTMTSPTMSILQLRKAIPNEITVMWRVELQRTASVIVR